MALIVFVDTSPPVRHFEPGYAYITVLQPA